jgi:DNA-binding IclR family transcriptional regulator
MAVTDSSVAPSVQRTIQLLENLLTHPQGLSLKDLLAESEGSRSALFILLNTLKSLGYIEQVEKRGRYRAGPRLLAWRGGETSSADLQTAFYQEASALALPETLALALPVEQGALLAAQVETSAKIRSVFPLGLRFPPESAAAQALSASPSAAVKQAGYAFGGDVESVELALPICADGQTPSAVLLLSAPAFRWSQARLTESLLPLREMAARLSYRLGAVRYTPWQTAAQELPTARRPLEAEAMRAFLAAPWIARLACLRADGTPHVVPVWQEWDGEHFYVAAWQGSLWAEYVLANPNVSLTVDEPWPPLRRVLARGQAFPLHKSDLPGGLNALLHRLRRRYLGPSGSLSSAEWQAFRITLDSITGWQGLS